MQRFKVLVQIYTDLDGSAGVPSDLTSNITMAKQLLRMAHHAPALEYFFFMGKYGPWKTNMLDSWEGCFDERAQKSTTSMSTVSSGSLTSTSLRSLAGLVGSDLLNSDIDAMIHLLQVCGMSMNKNDVLPWARNVGWRNGYYAGWKNLLVRFFGVCTISEDGSLKPCPKCDYAVVRGNLRNAHDAGVILAKIKAHADRDEEIPYSTRALSSKS